MKNVRFVCLGALIGAGGCASSPSSRPSPELIRLRSQVAMLRGERAGQAELVSELRNRLFILEDRVDTNRVEMSRQLPVVRLAPVGESPEPAVVAEREPEIEEDADDGRPRPLLRLHERRFDLPSRTLPLTGGTPSAELGRHDPLPVIAMDGLPSPRRSAPPSSGASETVLGPDASSEANARYEAAFSMFRARRFDEALQAFGQFVERYPQHSYADNALYWRGECHYAKREFRAALSEFERVLSRYPEGNKAPDSMLKAAYSRIELGELARARATLFRLVELFPRSDAARLATERAARLGPAASAGEVRR